MTLGIEDYVKMGNIFSDFSQEYKELLKKTAFMNDLQIALTAQSIGAVLYTENAQHFEIIRANIIQLKVEYLIPSGKEV